MHASNLRKASSPCPDHAAPHASRRVWRQVSGGRNRTSCRSRYHPLIHRSIVDIQCNIDSKCIPEGDDVGQTSLIGESLSPFL